MRSISSTSHTQSKIGARDTIIETFTNTDLSLTKKHKALIIQTPVTIAACIHTGEFVGSMGLLK